MKALILSLLFFPFVLLGQSEPVQDSFNFKGNTRYYISGDSGYFKDSKFLLGWHWGGSRAISEAMKMNQVHQSFPIDFNKICNNAQIIRGIDGIWAIESSDTGAMQSMAMQWEANLKIDTTDPPSFNTNINDANNPVFGFRYINPNITISSTDSKLWLDSSGSYINSLIMAEPWPSKSDLSVHKLTNVNTGIDHKYGDSCNGTRFYITVKLSRSFANDARIGNDSVLKIKIKHFINSPNSSEYIHFDSLPNPNQNGSYQIISTNGTNRGRARKLDSSMTKPDEFFITLKMLPVGTNEIVISSFFVCERNVPPNMVEVSYPYDSLKPEITYLGHCSINLDWVRIETFNARRLFFGGYDKSMHDSIQADLTLMNSSATRGIKTFRYYIRDEYNPSWFAAHRYFNKLIGNVGITEDGGVLSEQYFHYVRSPERWVNITSPSPKTSVPFLYNDNDSNKINDYQFTLGIGPGYEGNSEIDTNSSGYETFLRNNETIQSIKNTININNYTNALYYLYGKSSFQGYLENLMYELFVSGKYNFAYLNKIWWAEPFIGSNWGTNFIPNTTLCYIKNNMFRPKTGEEIRAITSQQILMGAKGFVYDREGSGEMNAVIGSGTFLGIIDNYPNLNNFNEDSLKSVFLGSDFLVSKEENGYDPTGLDKGFHKDTLAKYMHVDSTRIYKGMLSTRMELKHLHDWIRANDSLLMRQMLVCWMGKGYKQWYTQDTTNFHQDTIMKNFILMDSNFLRTRPINRMKFFYQSPPLEGYVGKYFEPWDSVFIDLSILRDSSDNNLSGNSWMLGVQNRRSSPLLWDTASSSIKFYATYELEQKAKYGGYTIDNVLHPANWWQSQLWSQGGAREITIPFNYKPVDTTEYCLLRIRDVGFGTSLDTDTSAWWFREPFRQRIDTIIGQDRSICLKLRAGEGRMIKIDVIHPGRARGDLSHSNQSKLTCFPILNAQGIATDSSRYHLVYFKPVSPGSEKNAVYYRRSLPVQKDSPRENIEWEPEICASCRIGEIDSLSCDYPSIVVRKINPNSSMVFVVYSCRDDPSVVGISKIVETKYPINNDIIVLPQDGAIIAYYNGKIRYDWGNPVVNANGGSGNYYAWSDSLNGITVGWKPLMSSSFALIDKSYIQQGSIFQGPTPYFSKHPSLNTYSYIVDNVDTSEKNCAVVWQEKPNSLVLKSQIYYTRLNRDTSGIHYYLPQFFVNSTDTVITNSSVDIACLSCDQTLFNKENCFPVIQRSLERYRIVPQIPRGIPNRRDRVFWQSESNPFSSILINRSINLRDSFHIPIRWSVYPITEIKYTGYNLSQPCIEQGISIGNRNSSNGNDILLNFVCSPLNSGSSLNDMSILQLPFTYTSSVTRDSIISHDLDLQIIGKGYFPHLAKNYKPNYEENNIWKNRRVYSADMLLPPLILSSAKNFYRKDDNFISISGFFGFKSNLYYYRINPPKIDGNEVGLYLPYTLLVDTLYGNSYEQFSTDTLKSEWFKVENSIELQFKCHGYDTTKAKMKIEKRNYGISAEVQLPNSTPDSLSVLRSYTLVNGQGEDYRLIFVNYDSLAYYSEEGFLDDLFSRDTLYSKNSVEIENIIDLNSQYHRDRKDLGISLSLFPNPADENVYTTAYLPLSAFTGRSQHQMIIKVFSSLGFELFRQEVKSGDTISIPTKDYPQGAYFIRAEEKADDYTIDVLPAKVQGFVIKR